MTGAVYILYVAKSHIVSGDITGGAGLGVRSADDEAEDADRNAVQALVEWLSEAGVEAHGEIVSATTHDVASVICNEPRSSTWTCRCLVINTTVVPAICSARASPTGSFNTTRRFRSYWPNLLAGAGRVSPTQRHLVTSRNAHRIDEERGIVLDAERHAGK